MEAQPPARVDRPDQITLPLSADNRATLFEACRAYIDHYCVFRSPPGQILLVSRAGGRQMWQLYMPVATFDRQFMARMALLFWDRYLPEFKERPFQLCGVASGGVPVVCALQAAAFRAGIIVNVFELKKAAKTYGLLNWIEGIVDPELPVLLVDDVSNAGSTLRNRAARLRSFGLNVLGAWTPLIAKPDFKPPRTIKLDETQVVPIDTLLEPHHIVRTHEQYAAKYGRPPQFHGVLR